MPNRELKNTLQHVNAFDIQLISSDVQTDGEIIDNEGFDSLLYAFQSGTLTTGTFTVLIQDGDEANLSDAADVDDLFLEVSEADTSFTASEDFTTKTIAYVGNKRFTRASIISAGGTANGTIGAIAILGHPGVAATGANS